MADDDNDNNVFVYLGQEVPFGVTHAVIDPSINVVRRWAFAHYYDLVSVIFHDGVEIIEAEVFEGTSLRGIKLLGVREIREGAFTSCDALSGVEFGDRLETIGVEAFSRCSSLRSIKLLSARTVQRAAFGNCEQLTDVEFGMNLERIGSYLFYGCKQLQRIVIPLKDDLFSPDPYNQRYNQFEGCENLTTVDIVGAEGIYNTISSFILESWKNEMNDEIDRINRELPNTSSQEKTDLIRLWIRSVINRMEHHKAEHNRLLKEHMTLIELALWKAKLDERDDGDSTLKGGAQRAKIDEESTRDEKRITSGADIIIKNVLPFLKLG